MPEMFIVRDAITQDISELISLANQWQVEGSSLGQTTIDFQPYLTEPTKKLWVLEYQDKIVGFLAVAEYGHEVGVPHLAVFKSPSIYIEVEEIYVAPKYRSKGGGALLINKLKTTATKNGITKFNVFSASKDLTAIIRFYQRHGFNLWGMQAALDIEK